METRYQPEIALQRKVCESCGEGIFEFAAETRALQKYICDGCTI